jgi:hypothetical protein
MPSERTDVIIQVIANDEEHVGLFGGIRCPESEKEEKGADKLHQRHRAASPTLPQVP